MAGLASPIARSNARGGNVAVAGFRQQSDSRQHADKERRNGRLTDDQIVRMPRDRPIPRTGQLQIGVATVSSLDALGSIPSLINATLIGTSSLSSGRCRPRYL